MSQNYQNARISDPVCISILAAIWVAAALVVDPIGNFPLNDDWAYASAVRAMVEHGELRLSGWTATNLIAQVFWGALFCLPFGFSFTALRFSTLLLAMFGVLATYALLREARAKPGTALIGALTLAFSPIYFALSFTFMTDVPFTAVSTVSSWLLLRGLRRQARIEVIAGLGFAMTAILIRQIGLAIPIAFALAYVAKRGLGVRHLFEAIIPIITGFAVQFTYHGELRLLGRVPATFGSQIDTLLAQLALPFTKITSDAAAIIFYAIIYTGFLLLPFLLLERAADFTSRSRFRYFGEAGAALLLTTILTAFRKLMPLHGNVLTKAGIGWDLAPMPATLRLVLTLFACSGAVMLVTGLIRVCQSLLPRTRSEPVSPEPQLKAFALAAIVTAFAPLPFLGLSSHGFYDRYLIVFMPWLLLLFTTINPTRRSYGQNRAVLVGGLAALVAIAVFSIAVTHDYLAFHRTRWVALHDTMRRYAVGPDRIDGGFEFNGWYLYDENYVIRPDKGWYWVLGDDYVIERIDRTLRPGYQKLAEYTVDWWLPWSSGQVIVERKMIGKGLGHMWSNLGGPKHSSHLGKLGVGWIGAVHPSWPSVRGIPG
jgi:hypothetical protein